MARSYSPEFRRRVIERVRRGHSVKAVAAELGVSEMSIFRWKVQDAVDRGERPGKSSREQSELTSARRRIRELETELAIIKKASEFYSSLDKIRPKGSSR
jgi:transposase-like protein